MRESSDGAKKHVAYRVSLPVAWPRDSSAPATYALAFPRDVTALDAFDRKYDGHCGSSEHGDGTFWHDWNPRASDCTTGDDVVSALATVTPHADGKLRYPEYDRIWSDGRLDVTAIFGIIDRPDLAEDWGYTEAAEFLTNAASLLHDVKVSHNRLTPSFLGDVTVTGTATIHGRERAVTIDALVVDTLADAGADFDARYDALSERADLVLYNGHAGLGANTSSLSKRGRVAPSRR